MSASGLYGPSWGLRDTVSFAEVVRNTGRSGRRLLGMRWRCAGPCESRRKLQLSDFQRFMPRYILHYVADEASRIHRSLVLLYYSRVILNTLKSLRCSQKNPRFFSVC